MTEFKVVSTRSLLTPRWWQFRRRFYLWRLYRDQRKELEAMGPEAEQIHRDIQAGIERAMLFGDEQ